MLRRSGFVWRVKKFFEESFSTLHFHFFISGRRFDSFRLEGRHHDTRDLPAQNEKGGMEN
jgi:hypothetical protein